MYDYLQPPPNSLKPRTIHPNNLHHTKCHENEKTKDAGSSHGGCKLRMQLTIILLIPLFWFVFSMNWSKNMFKMLAYMFNDSDCNWGDGTMRLMKTLGVNLCIKVTVVVGCLLPSVIVKINIKTNKRWLFKLSLARIWNVCAFPWGFGNIYLTKTKQESTFSNDCSLSLCLFLFLWSGAPRPPMLAIVSQHSFRAVFFAIFPLAEQVRRWRRLGKCRKVLDKRD